MLNGYTPGEALAAMEILADVLLGCLAPGDMAGRVLEGLGLLAAEGISR